MIKLKDMIGYIIAIVVILAIARFSGYLKGFTPNDFKDMYNTISEQITGNVGKFDNTLTFKSNNSNQSDVSYRVIKLPESIVKASAETGAWTDIFKSSKTSIFYIIENNDSFNSNFKSYLMKSGLDRYYNFNPYSQLAFKNYSVGNSSFTKICNSLQECNDLRKHSQSYTNIKSFLEKCSKSVCFINTNKRQYIILKSRDLNEAKQAAERLKNW